MDYLLRKKDWELEQARSTPDTPQALEDDELEAESTIDGESAEHVYMLLWLRSYLAEVDRILLQENEEFEALVSSMRDTADQGQPQHTIGSDYGSDEEEYDQIFMEVISRQGSAERSTTILTDDAPEQDQKMDISIG